MNAQKLPDMQNLPKEMQLIIMSGRIGIIAHTIAQKIHVSGLRALDLFYRSDTCSRLHNRATKLYLFGEMYIVDEFMLEMQAKQA